MGVSDHYMPAGWREAGTVPIPAPAGEGWQTRYEITYPDGRVREVIAHYDDEAVREVAAFDLMGTETRGGGTVTRAVFLSADGVPCGEVEA